MRKTETEYIILYFIQPNFWESPSCAIQKVFFFFLLCSFSYFKKKTESFFKNRGYMRVCFIAVVKFWGYNYWEFLRTFGGSGQLVWSVGSGQVFYELVEITFNLTISFDEFRQFQKLLSFIHELARTRNHTNPGQP